MPSEEPLEERCGATCRNGGYCTQYPVTGAERCRMHGGKDSGPPEKNQNATTHALSADPGNYHANLDDEGQTWVFEMSEAICDRIRANRGRIDPLDRTLARRVAIKLHIAANASEYISTEGLLQTIEVEDGGAQYTKEIPNALLTELRQYDREIWGELKKLGVIDDPESAKADAIENLASDDYEIVIADE